MPKDAVFTLKLERELRDAFMAEAKAADRPASQIVRELMTEYVVRRKEEQDYSEFLRRKVEIARAQRKADLSYSNEEVEAKFAARRAELRRLAEEAEQ